MNKILDDLEAGLGRARTVRVPAHAVEDKHQRGIVCNDDGGAVLVVRAVP